eukprot:15431199-Alexandrium_andersonii.AAC.1
MSFRALFGNAHRLSVPSRKLLIEKRLKQPPAACQIPFQASFGAVQRFSVPSGVFYVAGSA